MRKIAVCAFSFCLAGLARDAIAGPGCCAKIIMFDGAGADERPLSNVDKSGFFYDYADYKKDALIFTRGASREIPFTPPLILLPFELYLRSNESRAPRKRRHDYQCLKHTCTRTSIERRHRKLCNTYSYFRHTFQKLFGKLVSLPCVIHERWYMAFSFSLFLFEKKWDRERIRLRNSSWSFIFLYIYWTFFIYKDTK